MTSVARLHWRHPPPVEAPCPTDRNKILRLGISADLTGVGRDNFKRTPLYMVWAHLHGCLPPITNAAVAEATGLKPTYCTLLQARACFRGVNRPHDTEDGGDSVYIYVLKIAATLRSDLKNAMVCPIGSYAIPSQNVFTVQVRLNASLQKPVDELDGLVTRIEPVAGEAPTHALPIGHATRYAEQCW